MSIAITNLKFSYQHDKCVNQIDIPNWQLERGQIAFLHGPSGCGKSTLLKLIAGLLVPNEGNIFVLDQALTLMNTKKRDAFRASNIGYIGQTFNLISYLSPIENVQLASYVAGNTCPLSNAQQLLEPLNIPQSLWQCPTRNLSLGQQQRVAIARALVNKPSLIIADEPTSSLDPKNTADFMSLLMQFAQHENASVLFVSHDDSLKGYFNRHDSLPAVNLAEGTY